MSSTTERRFLLIDGLRGIAAISVVMFHLDLAITRSSPGWTPALIHALLREGFLGVDIFFVISGFVIAYSVRNGDYTPGYLLRFWFRRSIRLDPPYWFAIAAEIILIIAGLRFLPELHTPIPTAQNVVAHVFYAQNFYGYDNILTIFWTLCYEVQFYLFLVG